MHPLQLTGLLTRTSTNTYTCNSLSTSREDSIYNLTRNLDTNRWICNCPDFRKQTKDEKNADYKCKHLEILSHFFAGIQFAKASVQTQIDAESSLLRDEMERNHCQVIGLQSRITDLEEALQATRLQLLELTKLYNDLSEAQPAKPKARKVRGKKSIEIIEEQGQ